MQAIKYYRPFSGDYTTRMAGRVFTLCNSHNAVLCSVESSRIVPLNGLFSYLEHLEVSFCEDAYSGYAKNSVVILCLKSQNDDLLQEIYSILKEYEERRLNERGVPEIPDYGHPELIEIQIDGH